MRISLSCGTRRLLALAPLVALAACDPGMGTSAGSEDAASAAAGDEATPAPDFTLPAIGGPDITLADYRGKTVVLDFWATWCPPCLFQVPELNKLWDAHRDAGDVVVLGVAVDVEGAEVVGPWVAEQGVRYPIVLGSEDLARDFGAMGFPTLAIINPSGNIDSLHVGLIEVDELEKLVAPFSGG